MTYLLDQRRHFSCLRSSRRVTQRGWSRSGGRRGLHAYCAGRATPGAAATVFHRQNANGYTARRWLTSDGTGAFTTTFTADAAYRFYAVAGGVKSAPGPTQLITVTCTTSQPAFAPPPFTGLGGAPTASLQAMNGTATWARLRQRRQ